ncbi:TetR/AcrR family transcriptional regulator [Erythrobacter sp. LQ02-29]|uniref:TetR/AcrR family transcriptional regulator n=1 Tax=Erythrobacter sp. LQ02-29 TaxID=2920384 RepID=UPI001F4E29C0|nr:TetR/AcrR family transcriptional regulator [Erythrobacter sp. LQ02-29]
MATKISRPRGRPRRFDLDEAVATAQGLFHAKGFDSVSIADITAALGINPPSFYAAFGSKAALYDLVLKRYNDADAIPLDCLLRSDRPVAECLAAALEEAARFYTANPNTAGCLVVEGTRCTDRDAREGALAYNRAAEDMIRKYIAQRHPGQADRLTDFTATTMFGLSARARNGHGRDELLASARIAGSAIERMLASDGR